MPQAFKDGTETEFLTLRTNGNDKETSNTRRMSQLWLNGRNGKAENKAKEKMGRE